MENQPLKNEIHTPKKPLALQIVKAILLFIAAVLIIKCGYNVLANILGLLIKPFVSPERYEGISYLKSFVHFVLSAGFLSLGIYGYRKLFPNLDATWKKIALNIGLFGPAMLMTLIGILIAGAIDIAKLDTMALKKASYKIDSIGKKINWEIIENPTRGSKTDIQKEIENLKELEKEAQQVLKIFEKNKRTEQTPLSKYLIETINISKSGTTALNDYLASGKINTEAQSKLNENIKSLNSISLKEIQTKPQEVKPITTTPKYEADSNNITGHEGTNEIVPVETCLKIFSQGSLNEQIELIKHISKSSQNYPPLVLYMMSNILFQADKKDDATFWFYAAQLRGRYDANRHEDPNAGKVIGYYNNLYGKNINNYAFQNISKLKETISEVISWDATTPNNYNTDYISKSKLFTKIEVDPNLIDETKWGAIKKDTKADYLEGFKQAVETVTNGKEGRSHIRGPVPTPKMAISFNPKGDKASNWQIAYESASPEFIIIELTPNGESPENWKELVSTTIRFNVEVETYVKAWVRGLKNAGANITEAKKLSDESILITYKSASENGIWRYFQGSDGVYGLAYQTRPNIEDKVKVELWKTIIRNASLSPNPILKQ